MEEEVVTNVVSLMEGEWSFTEVVSLMEGEWLLQTTPV